MSDVRRFTLVEGKSDVYTRSADIYDRIMAVIYEHDNEVPLVAVLGVLELVKRDMIEEQPSE